MGKSQWLLGLLVGGAVTRLWLVATSLLLDGPGRLADVAAMRSWLTGAPATDASALPSLYQIVGGVLWHCTSRFEPAVALRLAALSWGWIALCVPFVSYRLVRRSSTAGDAAMLGALVTILAPLLAVAPPELTAAALAAPACALGFYFVVRAVETGSLGGALAAGVATSVALLADVAAMPIVVATAAVVAGIGHHPRSTRAGQLCSLLLAAIVVLAAYVAWLFDAISVGSPASWLSALAGLVRPNLTQQLLLVVATLAILAVVRRAQWGALRSAAAIYLVAVSGGVLADRVLADQARPTAGYLHTALVPIGVWVAHAWAGSPPPVWRRRTVLAAVSALLVWAVFSGASQRRRVAYDENALAVLAYQTGFEESARRTFERLSTGRLHLAHENLAHLALDADRPREALRHARAALDELREISVLGLPVRPQIEAEYYNLLSVIASRLQWPKVGRAAAQRALELVPTLPAAIFDYGVLLLDTGNPELAEAHFAAHALRIGQLPNVPLLHATAAQRSGDCRAAQALLPWAGDVVRQPAPVRLFSTTGSIDDVALRRGRRIDTLPSYVDRGYVQAVCQAELGDVPAAATELRRRLAAGQLPVGVLQDEAWRRAGAGRLPAQVLPNIVVIMIDTLRADHVGAYGYARPTTPNLDRLAADGVRFANAYSVSSWTGPAVASLFTGLMPARHGFTDYTARMRNDVPALAEELGGLGYASAAFSANFVHVRPSRGVGRGFQEFHVLDEASTPEDVVARIAGKPMRGYDAREVTQRVVGWLQARRQQPFFLYVHYLDPHAGYQPPARHRAVFTQDDFSGDDGASLAELTPLERDGVPIDDAGLQRLIDLYDGEVHFVDEEIARLVDHLDGLGYCENCVVIVTADHGEEFRDHGHFFHGFTLYEEQLRVPLIVYGRGAWKFAPRVVRERVQLVDLFPLLIELVGGRVPADLDGVSLRSLVVPGRGTYRRSTVRGELHPDPVVEAGMHPRRHARAVVRDGVKLLSAPDGTKELYFLDRDPAEQTNLAVSEPALADRLAAGEDENPPSGRAQEEPRLTDAHREQLRALGYLP